MASRVPDSVTFENRTVPLYTYGQLQQQPRQKLKNRAQDLQDLVGKDRLPPLVASGSVESVTLWILDVQSAIARSAGLEITPADLGQPADAFGAMENEHGLLHPTSKGFGGAPPRQPMQDLVQGPGSDAEAAYLSAMQAAAATRARNQAGSNIFG